MFKMAMDQKSILGQKLARLLNQKESIISVGRFADTESFVKFDNINDFRNQDVLFLKQFIFDQYNLVNDQLLQLLLSVDFVKKAGAKKITAILPYLIYGRHDKGVNKNNDGPITFIGELLKTAGIDEVVSLELHAPEVKNYFAVKLDEITLQDFWSNHIKKISNSFDASDYCIVSPDKGGEDRVRKIAKILNKDYLVLQKKRIGPDQPVILDLEGDFKDKIVIIVDDILDTGKTAIQCCQMLIKNGAKKVIGCFTHGVFAPGTLQKAQDSDFSQIFITDTIVTRSDVLNSKKISVLSIVDLLGNYLKENF